MQAWGTSLLFAVLVAAVPFTYLIKMLMQLPRALALSHRRWPLQLNYGLVAAVTSYSTYFIHRGYYGTSHTAGAIAAEFLIATVVYAFAIALLQRQFCGVYPEFIITSSFVGFGLRKTRYRNIQDVQTVSTHSGETELRIETVHGRDAHLVLPTRYVSIFFEQIQKTLHDG
jgi:fluoride ion exporter CrcB/FEX